LEILRNYDGSICLIGKDGYYRAPTPEEAKLHDNQLLRPPPASPLMTHDYRLLTTFDTTEVWRWIDKFNKLI